MIEASDVSCLKRQANKNTCLALGIWLSSSQSRECCCREPFPRDDDRLRLASVLVCVDGHRDVLLRLSRTICRKDPGLRPWEFTECRVIVGAS